ncbi:hypothetical protein LOAG_12653 [Loa loa]|uniref:Uncharacterized protein n=1 Tax=Loa loa TaxID=7209 RepID=A0A1S0TKW1_LOALO|nr:hypothetical protein LOAG_12653 [Loa loa]EFO15855.2 hypothetical protein LOAG_12653 [Loa loa]
MMVFQMCPHITCNAIIQGTTKCLEHRRKHSESFRYHCKQLGYGEAFHNHSSSFFPHKEEHQPKFKSAVFPRATRDH